jgi:hypothetical protein
MVRELPAQQATTASHHAALKALSLGTRAE